jgi:hypothetical protein
MGLVEFGVFIPSEAEIDNVNSRKKIRSSADRDQHVEKNVIFSEMEVAVFMRMDRSATDLDDIAPNV